MRHHNVNRKFGREKDVRNALMKSLAVALVSKEKIETTEAKAKELRPYIEKLVTKAKLNTLASRRLVSSRIGIASGKKLAEIIAPKYKDRKGGYTRIVKTRVRSDGSRMAHIEFV